jgi:signal transduction histidine kinase
MPAIQKFQDTVDWARRIQFILQVAGVLFSASAWTTTWHWIAQHPGLWAWRWPICFLVSSLSLCLFAIILRVVHRSQKKKMPDDDVNRILTDVKLQGAKAILLGFMEARVIELQQQLEALWHHWNNSGEKLIHPLDARLDQLKNYTADGAMALFNERRDFMVLYAHHLNTSKAEFSDFTSPVIAEGYPSDSEYHQVLANLKLHAEKLKTESEEAWKAC